MSYVTYWKDSVYQLVLWVMTSKFAVHFASHNRTCWTLAIYRPQNSPDGSGSGQRQRLRLILILILVWRGTTHALTPTNGNYSRSKMKKHWFWPCLKWDFPIIFGPRRQTRRKSVKPFLEKLHFERPLMVPHQHAYDSKCIQRKKKHKSVLKVQKNALFGSKSALNSRLLLKMTMLHTSKWLELLGRLAWLFLG